MSVRLPRPHERTVPLGKLLYGHSGIEIEIDDRVLAHLQVVIGTKLRRGEGFFVSWRDDPSLGDGRSSIWMEPSIAVSFKFDSAERHQLNRDWLEILTESSNHPQGLLLSAEPGQQIVLPRSRV